MRRHTTWRALGALALTATLVLSGCGDKKDDSAKGSDSSTGDSSSVGKDAGSDLTKDTFFTEVSKAQKKAGSSHVVMTTSLAGQDITAEGDMLVGDTAAETAMSMTMKLGSQGTMELRLVKNVIYLNFGPVTENKFAKVDLNDKSNPLTQQYGSLVENFDPAAQVDAYKDAVKSVTKKGDTQKIDGVETTPYVVVIDTSKVAGSSADAAKLPDDLTLTMYLGEDNLPRKVESSITASGTSVKTSMLYSKWGEKVDVKAPPASEVTDKNPLAGLSGAAG